MKTFAQIVSGNRYLFVIVMSVVWLFLTGNERDKFKEKWPQYFK